MPRVAAAKKETKQRKTQEETREQRDKARKLATERVERLKGLLKGIPYVSSVDRSSRQIGDMTYALDRKVYVKLWDSIPSGSVIQIDCTGEIKDLGRDDIGLAEINGKLEYILINIDRMSQFTPINAEEIEKKKNANERPPKPDYADWVVVNAHPGEDNDDMITIKPSAYLGKIVNVIPKLPTVAADKPAEPAQKPQQAPSA